jgi:hypothetical protein
VLAMSPIGKFVLAVPPVNGVGDERQLQAAVEADCRSLRNAGINCEAGIVVDSAERALLDIAVAESADLIVVGKRPHGATVDAVWRTCWSSGRSCQTAGSQPAPSPLGPRPAARGGQPPSMRPLGTREWRTAWGASVLILGRVAVHASTATLNSGRKR